MFDKKLKNIVEVKSNIKAIDIWKIWIWSGLFFLSYSSATYIKEKKTSIVNKKR